jgi:hypothetical protein
MILQDEQNFPAEDFFSYCSSTRESWGDDIDSEVSLSLSLSLSLMQAHTVYIIFFINYLVEDIKIIER